MDFNPAQHAGLFAALLLLPGIAFLFALVVYLAFIGHDSAGRQSPRRACLKCGRTLLPDEMDCPDCLDPPPLPIHAPPQPPSSDLDQPPRSPPSAEFSPREIDSPADSSSTYEAELVDEAGDPPPKEHD